MAGLECEKLQTPRSVRPRSKEAPSSRPTSLQVEAEHRTSGFPTPKERVIRVYRGLHVPLRHPFKDSIRKPYRALDYTFKRNYEAANSNIRNVLPLLHIPCRREFKHYPLHRFPTTNILPSDSTRRQGHRLIPCLPTSDPKTLSVSLRLPTSASRLRPPRHKLKFPT